MKKINLSLDPTLRKEQLKILKKRKIKIFTCLICTLLAIIGVTVFTLGALNTLFLVMNIGVIITAMGLIPLVLMGIIYIGYIPY